jgi:hypothetical protein
VSTYFFSWQVGPTESRLCGPNGRILAPMESNQKNEVMRHLTAAQRRKLVMAMRQAGFAPKTKIVETVARGNRAPMVYYGLLGR